MCEFPSNEAFSDEAAITMAASFVVCFTTIFEEPDVDVYVAVSEGVKLTNRVLPKTASALAGSFSPAAGKYLKVPATTAPVLGFFATAFNWAEDNASLVVIAAGLAHTMIGVNCSAGAGANTAPPPPPPPPGATGATSIDRSTIVVVVVAPFAPVIVNLVKVSAVVGVPVICPFVLEITKGDGKAGEIV